MKFWWLLKIPLNCMNFYGPFVLLPEGRDEKGGGE